MKKLFYFFIIIFTFSSCKEEDNLPPNNNDVSIKTLSHNLNIDGGVTLIGQINNVEIPIDYGFIISTEENGTYDNKFTNWKLKAGIYNGQFSEEFRSDLFNETTYYYNTIALKNDEYIYGQEQKFIANGSASPQIKSIFPNKAHLGDTISINGLYFSKRSEIFFNELKSYPLISNDTLIKCIVTNNPDINKQKLPKLELKIKNSTQNETIYNDFSLYTPRIDSVRPYEVFIGDTITIYGSHFSTAINGNRLTILNNPGSNYTRLIKASRNELVWVLDGIKTYKPTIQLESQHQRILAENKYKLKLPTITGISKNILKYGDKLTVYGTNFPEERYFTSDSLQYKLGEKKMPFLDVYRDSLVLEISDKYSNLDFIMEGVNISIFGNKISFNESIVLDENYVRVSFQQGNIYATGTIGEDLYALKFYYYPNQKTLLKLNKETNYFEEFNSGAKDTELAKSYNIKFNGTKFYSMNGLKFFSYDVITNTEKQLTSFPGEYRSAPLMEVVDDYLYYGLGINATNPNALKEIWRYSFSRDEWEFVVNFPEITDNNNAKRNPLVFVIGNKIYIGSGQYMPSKQITDFWEFDTTTNNIVRKEDLPMIISEKISPIVINNRAFFDYDGLTHIYDPLSDKWSVKNTGMNFNGHNPHWFQSNEFVYSGNFTKIKKSYFDK